MGDGGVTQYTTQLHLRWLGIRYAVDAAVHEARAVRWQAVRSRHVAVVARNQAARIRRRAAAVRLQSRESAKTPGCLTMSVPTARFQSPIEAEVIDS